MKQRHQKCSVDQQPTTLQDIRILDLHAVKKKTSLGKTLLYKLISEQRFPSQVHLVAGGKKVGWIESEVDAYLSARAAVRGKVDD